MGKKKPAIAILGAVATTVIVPLVKKAIDKKRGKAGTGRRRGE